MHLNKRQIKDCPGRRNMELLHVASMHAGFLMKHGKVREHASKNLRSSIQKRKFGWKNSLFSRSLTFWHDNILTNIRWTWTIYKCTQWIFEHPSFAFYYFIQYFVEMATITPECIFSRYQKFLAFRIFPGSKHLPYLQPMVILSCQAKNEWPSGQIQRLSFHLFHGYFTFSKALYLCDERNIISSCCARSSSALIFPLVH